MSPNLEFKVRLIYYLTFLLIRDYGLGWVLSLGFHKVKVAQSCPTLWNPSTIQSMEFSRPEYWSG